MQVCRDSVYLWFCLDGVKAVRIHCRPCMNSVFSRLVRHSYSLESLDGDSPRPQDPFSMKGELYFHITIASLLWILWDTALLYSRSIHAAPSLVQRVLCTPEDGFV